MGILRSHDKVDYEKIREELEREEMTKWFWSTAPDCADGSQTALLSRLSTRISMTCGTGQPVNTTRVRPLKKRRPYADESASS